MTTATTDDGGAGYIKLPRRVSLIAVFGALPAVAALASWLLAMHLRIEALEAADRRREVRVDQLVSDRDRIIRVEEQMRIAIDLLHRMESRLERVRSPP